MKLKFGRRGLSPFQKAGDRDRVGDPRESSNVITTLSVRQFEPQGWALTTLGKPILLRNRDKTIAIAFNDPKRSQANIQLMNIVAEGLLTDAELNQFSEETRERIEGTTRFRNS